MNQSVSITQPFLPLYNRSWTFEAWIYLHSCSNGTNYPILGQCEAEASDRCLHLVVNQLKLFLGFYNDRAESLANLTASQWYHTAFMFDSATRNQSIYLDGSLAACRQANNSYQGTNGTLNIGVNFWSSGNQYFDGLIDQLSYTNRSKTSEEILRDATLTLHFSFDGNSTVDEGPLSIHGWVGGSTSFLPGRRGQALQIGNITNSYFTIQGLVLLGRDNQSYSFAIWIKPAAINQSTIIQMARYPDGNGSWSIPVIGLNSAGQLVTTSWNGSGVTIHCSVVPTDRWTHVVSTYSLTYGLRLYVNGSVCNVSSPFPFQGSGTPNYLFVGSPRASIISPWWSDIVGQYSGAVDELQVYSRELTADEINVLASPAP